MTEHPLQPVGLKAQAVSFQASPPLSLYIHIPWCVRKCPYCDFNSHEARTPSPLQGEGWGEGGIEQQYVAALVRDLELALPQVWGRKVGTVFIGGGTPSLLSGESVAELLRQVRMLLRLDLNAEITLEANPGTVEAERFAAYRDAGVNRLSLGIQSFNDAHLQALGRIHSADEAKRAIEIAQRHFDNINLDLMYALPQQTLEQSLQDVQTALSFAPQHLSCYHLTLEPNTLFAHQPPPLPDDDASAEMQQRIEALLAEHGYEHYETSAFAQATLSPNSLPQAGERDAALLRKLPSKRRARHNLNYWRFGDYLGIGAGAHSKLSFHDKVLRQMRHKQPQAYLDAVARSAPVQEEHEVAPADLGFEFMMNALRLNEGFDSALFQERTSLPLLSIRRELEEAEKKGLLLRDGQRIAPTELGKRFLNDLLEIFLREEM
ncbi:MAG: YggW family oxidoreductase [Gallionellales bacterium GWA2_60_18]|nr:MAG: YggW family oxidoreductase [Gallionellales bacterium GWA2_60_18]